VGFIVSIVWFYHLVLLNKLRNELAIWFGVGNNQPITSRRMTQAGTSLITTVSTVSVATLEVLVDWSMLSTLALGLTLTVGAILFVVPIVCELVFPAWTFAATFGPPPVRRLSGPLLQLTVSIETKSSSDKREDRPDSNFNNVYILCFY